LISATPRIIVRENIVSHVAVWIDAACVISDIVKRRSIRVGSCSRLLREPSLSPDHFGARALFGMALVVIPGRRAGCE